MSLRHFVNSRKYITVKREFKVFFSDFLIIKIYYPKYTSNGKLIHSARMFFIEMRLFCRFKPNLAKKSLTKYLRDYIINFVRNEVNCMQLELRDIFVTDGSQLPVSLSLDLSDTEVSGYFPLSGPVSFDGGVYNRAGAVTLEGSAEYDYTAPCDRCGDECTEHGRVEVYYTLVTALEGDDEDDYLVIPDYMLEVDSVVRSDVLLSLPTKHLCSPECKGLCSSCGMNLNHGSCSCDRGEDNPFASALSKFMS